MATVICDGCQRQSDGEMMCNSCVDQEITQAEGENSPEEDEGPAAAVVLRSWLEREVLLKGLPREIAAHFERCAEDMEAGDA